MDTYVYEQFFNYIKNLAGTDIPKEDKQKIMEIFKPVKLSKKELFIREGEMPDSIAFNVSGLLRCFYIDKKGNDVTKYFCFEGTVISYMGFVLKKESKYYIEALEECILLAANYKDFEALINESTIWLKVIKTVQEQALIYKEERESSFLLESATERYVNLIKSFPDIERRINLGYIASYLGISQVSLSRIRNKLNKI